jgi:hypothetical protein
MNLICFGRITDGYRKDPKQRIYIFHKFFKKGMRAKIISVNGRI